MVTRLRENTTDAPSNPPAAAAGALRPHARHRPEAVHPEHAGPAHGRHLKFFFLALLVHLVLMMLAIETFRGPIEAVRHTIRHTRHLRTYRYIRSSTLAPRKTSLFPANQSGSPAAATIGKRALQLHLGKHRSTCSEDTAGMGASARPVRQNRDHSPAVPPKNDLF
jgi:hypothetical protein